MPTETHARAQRRVAVVAEATSARRRHGAKSINPHLAHFDACANPLRPLAYCFLYSRAGVCGSIGDDRVRAGIYRSLSSAFLHELGQLPVEPILDGLQLRPARLSRNHAVVALHADSGEPLASFALVGRVKDGNYEFALVVVEPDAGVVAFELIFQLTDDVRFGALFLHFEHVLGFARGHVEVLGVFADFEGPHVSRSRRGRKHSKEHRQQYRPAAAMDGWRRPAMTCACPSGGRRGWPQRTPAGEGLTHSLSPLSGYRNPAVTLSQSLSFVRGHSGR